MSVPFSVLERDYWNDCTLTLMQISEGAIPERLSDYKKIQTIDQFKSFPLFFYAEETLKSGLVCKSSYCERSIEDRSKKVKRIIEKVKRHNTFNKIRQKLILRPYFDRYRSDEQLDRTHETVIIGNFVATIPKKMEVKSSVDQSAFSDGVKRVHSLVFEKT
jgi:hypothetical protein